MSPNASIGALDSEVIKRRLTMLSNIATSKTSKSSHTAVLNFRAARDHLVTASSAASIRRTFQNTATVVFKAPHFLLLTQPAECWFHIEKFLADMA
jgi:pimeloyl-ACP methyl ester carboxylesterase